MLHYVRVIILIRIINVNEFLVIMLKCAAISIIIILIKYFIAYNTKKM
jgi:hypothetical protein